MKLSHCLRSETRFRIVVIGNYKVWSDTVVPCRAKVHPLRRRRSYFAPIKCGLLTPGPYVVEAPGTAPGSDQFITKTVYRHSRQADTANIGTNNGKKKVYYAIFAANRLKGSHATIS